MTKFAFLLFSMIVLRFSNGYAQELSAQEKESIKNEIESLFIKEQEAFVKGDCDALVAHYSSDVTFFANGRQAPSRDFILNFCKRIPRPFERSGSISDKTIVVSSTTAYSIREIVFETKKEIVTKIWVKTKEGWKITHFHSSIHNGQ